MKAWLQNITGGMTVEAAFVLPIFAIMALGAIDGANLFLQNHKMETQLALAGSYLSKTRDPIHYETNAKRLAVTGRFYEESASLIPNWNYEDVIVTYRSVDNLEDEDGLDYRGGETVRMVKLSSRLPYSGFGILSSVANGSIYLRAEYEERIVGDDAA